MRKFVALLCLLAGGYAVSPAQAAPTETAEQALASYMRRTKIPCYTRAGEGRCTIASLNEGMKTFHGMPSPGPETFVAFVTWQYDKTGNAMDQMSIVLRNAGGRWVTVGRADHTVGTDPRDVRFTPDAITYTGTVVGPNDTRAAPTGKAAFRLSVGTDSVRFLRP